MIEEWKDIEELPNGQISNKGRIKKDNLIYSTFTTKNGQAIYFSVDSKAVLFYIDELVEKYFGTLVHLTTKPSRFTKTRKKRNCCGSKRT